MVHKNKTNASSFVDSVYLFARAFLQPYLEGGWRFLLSAIRRPRTSLDRGAVLLPFPPGQDGQGPGLVAGLVPGTNRKRRLQLGTNKHLHHLTQINLGSNRHIFGTLSWTRF
jgi:hypothetical protein